MEDCVHYEVETIQVCEVLFYTLDPNGGSGRRSLVELVNNHRDILVIPINSPHSDQSYEEIEEVEAGAQAEPRVEAEKKDTTTEQGSYIDAEPEKNKSQDTPGRKVVVENEE